MSGEFVPIELQHIDEGAAEQVYNDALLTVCEDCIERNRLIEKREVTLKVTVEPSEKDATQAHVKWSVSSKIPGVKGNVTTAIVREGGYHVNRNDRERPLQRSFADMTLPDNVEKLDRMGEGNGN